LIFVVSDVPQVVDDVLDRLMPSEINKSVSKPMMRYSYALSIINVAKVAGMITSGRNSKQKNFSTKRGMGSTLHFYSNTMTRVHFRGLTWRIKSPLTIITASVLAGHGYPW